MAQRTGGKIHTGQMMGNMTGKPAAVLIMGLQLIHFKEARFRQRRINCRTGMTLAQNKTVALRPIRLFRTKVHDFRI